MRFQKFVYNQFGQKVPDIWSPNNKIASNWYNYFTTQAVSYLLGNGVTFKSESNKTKLGKDFDKTVKKSPSALLVKTLKTYGNTTKQQETKENLDNFAKTNYEEYKNLIGKRENLWKRYHRAKTEDKKNEILTEINYIQPKIKELNKYNKYCKEITKRAEGIQNNLNNFDKDIQKEKDNSRY